ncbi:MAG: CvpA family protein [Actinomycetota bacterium]
MAIYDLIVLGVVVALVVRGWLRGLVREALEIGVLIVGTFLVFRLSPPVGSIIAGMANIPYEVARIVAGVILFLALVFGGAVAARLLSTALKIVPGATLLNRFGGALAGAVYAGLVVILATTLASVAPVSAGMRETIDGSVDASAVGRRIVDPDGPIQQAVASTSGQDVYATVIALQSIVGDRLAAGTLPIPMPDVGDAALVPSQVDGQHVFDELNRERIAEGLDPLAWSGDLAVVAVARAGAVYRSGMLALDDDLQASLSAQGVPGTINTDMVVLAASPDGVVEAFLDTSSYRDAIVDKQYRKAGIGVVDGPYGLLAVQVLAG